LVVICCHSKFNLPLKTLLMSLCFRNEDDDKSDKKRLEAFEVLIYLEKDVKSSAMYYCSM